MSDQSDLVQIDEVPIETCQVLATCHSLMHVEDKLIGDPIEKATLSVLPWTLTKGDVVMCRSLKQSLKIQKRFHFNRSVVSTHPLIRSVISNHPLIR